MARYDTKEILKSTDRKQYYRGKFYPNIPLNENDSYVVTTIGDRYDLLAQQYYNDQTLWWIIAIANVGDYTPEIPLNSLFIPVGTQLRIPVDIQNTMFKYAQINRL